MPNGRKVHHNAIPRLGGILFTPSMMMAILITIPLHVKTSDMHAISTTSFILTIGIFIIYLVGLIDDLVNVQAKHKFIFQIVSSAFIPACGLYINNFYGLFGITTIPFWIGAPLTIFVFLLIVNAVNLIDGIDGLAAGLSILALGSFAFLFLYNHASPVFSIIAIALMGSVVAFFYYNFWGNPEKGTKTFMGDSGSLILGYMIAFLSVKYAMSNPRLKVDTSYTLLASITIVLIPTFDLIRVAFGRIRRGKAIFSPDKTHLHHKLMDCGFTMHQALYFILGLYIFFALINWGMIELVKDSTITLLLDIVVFTAVNLILNRFKKTPAKAEK